MVNYQALNHSGYVVVPNFLTSQEVSTLREDYNTTTASFGHYGIKIVSKHIIDRLYSKLISTLSDIRSSSLVKADTLIYPQLYINNQRTFFDWHQEHESWYLEQDSINHLNFYIPIKKDSPDRSGISVIPNNVFQDYYSIMTNKGARRLIPGDSTVVIDDDLGDTFNLPFNINDYAVTPSILPGDLLLMRGDLVHKTQDSETERHAISIRCTFGNTLVSRSRLFSGCDTKLQYLDNNQKIYSRINSIFGDEDSIPLSRILSELLYEVK